MKNLYAKQTYFQKMLTKKKVLPEDDPTWFAYHIVAMQEELGEVLKADKRWKSHRNTRYDKEEKLDELADVVITTFNLGIFSGFTFDEICDTINKKIQINIERLHEEMHNDSNN